MATNEAHDSEIEGLNRRNYTPGESLSFLTDALYFDREGEYFHTVDGRFAQIWMIGGVDRSTLGPEHQVEVSRQMSRIISEYPYGSSGQIIKHTHRGIAPVVESFLQTRSSNPFGDAILNSFADRQYNAAMSQKGFFANISPRMMEQAKADIESELEGDKREAGIKLIERSTSSGTYPYVSEFYLVFLWEPPKSTIGKVASFTKSLLSGFGVLDIEHEVYKEYARQSKMFQNLAGNIEKTILTANLGVANVTGQGLVDLLYRILNPVRAHYCPSPIWKENYTVGDLLAENASKPPSDVRKGINQTVGFQPIEPYEKGFRWPFSMGGEKQYYYGQVTSVGGLPDKQSPGFLQDALASIEGENLISINFSITPKLTVASRLWARQKAVDLAANFSSSESGIQRRREQDLNAVKEATASDNVYNRQRMLDASIHCSFFGFDEADVEERAMEAERRLFDEGIHETVRGDAIIHHGLPLNYRPAARSLLRRDHPMLTSHLGRLAPLFVEYQGVESPAILVNNREGRPIYLDLFGTQTKTAHGLVCGSTGTGKSFAFNQLLMTMMAKYRPKIWLIDKGRSYESLCIALDGNFIDLVQDEQDGLKPTSMNPFYIPKGPDGLPRKPSSEEKEFLCNWLIAAIRAGSDEVALNASTSSLLTKALGKFYDEWSPSKEPVLSDFIKTLKQVDFSDLTGLSLAEKLSMFFDGGPYSKLFDAPLDVDWENDLIVLETGRMANSKALPVAMLSLFRQIEQYSKHKLPQNRPKIVGVDEAWNTIANKEAANALGGFYRELRKYKGGCLLISQGLTDFIKLVKQEGGAEDGILTNTSHYFLLACTDADYRAAKDELGFSDEEIAAWSSVASLPPFFSEVFYRQRMKNENYESGVFRIYSAPVPLWIATTDPDDVEMRTKRVRELVNSGVGSSDARRIALTELAEIYPYGSRYQLDEEQSHAA